MRCDNKERRVREIGGTSAPSTEHTAAGRRPLGCASRQDGRAGVAGDTCCGSARSLHSAIGCFISIGRLPRAAVYLARPLAACALRVSTLRPPLAVFPLFFRQRLQSAVCSLQTHAPAPISRPPLRCHLSLLRCCAAALLHRCSRPTATPHWHTLSRRFLHCAAPCDPCRPVPAVPHVRREQHLTCPCNRFLLSCCDNRPLHSALYSSSLYTQPIHAKGLFLSNCCVQRPPFLAQPRPSTIWSPAQYAACRAIELVLSGERRVSLGGGLFWETAQDPFGKGPFFREGPLIRRDPVGN